MKICKYILFLCLIILFSSSCNKKAYFSSDIRKNLESQNIDLKKIQYFIDNDIVLSREIACEAAKVSRGKVIIENGKYFENIILRANTKGICTITYPDRIQISFEKGENKTLTFATPKTLGNHRVYQLSNDDIYGNFSNTVNYDGNLYTLVMKDYFPRLMIEKQLIEKENRENRTMKGRRVN